MRAYLVGIDELTALGDIFSKKLDFFKRLRIDCDAFEALDNSADTPPDNPEGETTSDRIAFAEHMMEESATQCKRLNADLRESLNSVSILLPCVPFPIPLTQVTPALPTSVHRTERARHHRRYPEQSHLRLHWCHDCIPPIIFLHVVLWNEPPGHHRDRKIGVVLLESMRELGLWYRLSGLSLGFSVSYSAETLVVSDESVNTCVLVSIVALVVLNVRRRPRSPHIDSPYKFLNPVNSILIQHAEPNSPTSPSDTHLDWTLATLQKLQPAHTVGQKGTLSNPPQPL